MEGFWVVCKWRVYDGRQGVLMKGVNELWEVRWVEELASAKEDLVFRA